VAKHSKITYDSLAHVRNMLQCTSGINRAQFLPILEKSHVTIDLNGKRHPVMACSQLGRIVQLPTLSHLGGVAANIGTYSGAGAYTLARACANAL